MHSSSSLLLAIIFSSFISSIFSFVDIHAVLNPITKPIVDFCTGGFQACAVFDNGKMKCWGPGANFGLSGYFGQTPYSIGDYLPYINVGSSLNITRVTCLDQAICATLSNSTLYCIGMNFDGQVGRGVADGFIPEFIGDDSEKLPVVNLGTGLTAISVAAGYRFTCVLTSEKKVKCFGSNIYGQLGYGDKVNRGSSPSDMGDDLPFVDLGTDIEVASIHSTLSAFHSCAVLSAPANVIQRIKCWGWNPYNQLGYGDSNNRGDDFGEMGDNLTLVDFGAESRVSQVGVSIFHTCALLVNNAMKCYAGGTNGQLGSGSINSFYDSASVVPFVPIDSDKTIKYLGVGYLYTCILYDDMLTMKCIGSNNYGQLGQGDTLERGNTPATMIPNITAIDFGTGSLKIKSMHIGAGFNCVVFVDSSVKCFGWNGYGQLGIGSTESIGDAKYEMGTNITFTMLFGTPPPTSSPTISCNYPKAKLCKRDSKCVWKVEKKTQYCTLFNCADLSKGQCNKEKKRCSWDKPNKVCNSKT